MRLFFAPIAVLRVIKITKYSRERTAMNWVCYFLDTSLNTGFLAMPKKAMFEVAMDGVAHIFCGNDTNHNLLQND